MLLNSCLVPNINDNHFIRNVHDMLMRTKDDMLMTTNEIVENKVTKPNS